MTKKFLTKLSLFLCCTLLLPIASTVSAAATEPQIIGASALTMDLDTGEVIYSKNANVERSLASTTKLLTSLLFAENIDKGTSIPYSAVSAGLQETTLNTNYMGNTVKAGDTMTVEDVMEAVLIFSANDAAIMMAEAVAGSVDAFANMMNEKAASLGATNTKFINPHGLETDSSTYNYTTAYDLALIAKAAYANDWIRETMLTPSTYVTINGLRIDFDTRNKLLNQFGNVGGKTGTETMAGHCFVGFFNRDGRNLVTVVLGSEYGADGSNVFNDTKAIADYGYAAEKVAFKASGEEVSTVDLEYKLFRFFGPTKTISVPVTLLEDAQYYKNEYTDANAAITFSGDTSNAWKLASNNEVSLTFTAGSNSTPISGELKLATSDLLKANAPIYIATVLIIVIIIVLVIVLISFINKSRRRRNRRNRYYR